MTNEKTEHAADAFPGEDRDAAANARLRKTLAFL
jgi:hypothetical protein